VIAGTSVDLGRIIKSHHPVRQVTYALEEVGTPRLSDVLAQSSSRFATRSREQTDPPNTPELATGAPVPPKRARDHHTPPKPLLPGLDFHRSSKAIASVAVLRRRVCMGTAHASAARMETVALAAKGELVALRRFSGVGVA
jgi:hypothetical protein